MMKLLSVLLLSGLALSQEPPAGNTKPEKISATAGGIVKEGDSITLTYNVGKAWDRCFWFWYISDDEYEYCNFDFQSSNGSATVHKCEPEEMADRISYTGTDPNQCTITIVNATMDENGTWAARLDTELKPTFVDVIVALPAESAEITFNGDSDDDTAVDSLSAGANGTVRCVVKGGRPAPDVSLEIDGLNQTRIVDSVTSQEPDEDGVYTTEQVFVIVPSAEDDGRNVTCTASVEDGDGVVLFDLVSADAKALSVTFAPTAAANQTAKGKEGGEAEVSFVFRANPAPKEVEWFVTTVTVADNGNGTDNATTDDGSADDTTVETVSLKAGQDDDKYAAADVVDEEEGNKYRATFTVKNLTAADATKTYSVKVTNDVNVTEYFFTVEVSPDDGGDGGDDDDDDDDDDGETGEGGDDDDDDEEGGGGSSAVFIVLGVIVVIGLILGGVFVYKKKMVNNETAPLRS